jgi:AraC-like DNA-binding protein
MKMSFVTARFSAQNVPSYSLSVFQCGWQRCHSSHVAGIGVREHYVLHYIIAGKGSFHCGGQVYPLGPNEGFLIMPYEKISYCAGQDDPWEYLWIAFNGAEAGEYLALTGLGKDHPIFKYDRDDQMKKHMWNALSASKNDQTLGFAMIGHLFLILACLVRQNTMLPPKRLSSQYLERALKYIAENYAYKIGVADLARFVGIERSYLYKIFIRQIGRAPQEYLNDYRINKAVDLLRTTTLSITEIADSIGFDDVAHFSHLFKKKKLLSPLKFRQRMAEGKN